MSGRRLQIQLQPEVLRWARERVGLAPDVLAKKLDVNPERLREWETSGRISIAQVDRLAHHTRTPLGYLYLPQPVEDDLPIPDFRAAGDRAPARPSPDLLETIEMMQRRQAWLRDELVEGGQAALDFVGSATVDDPVRDVAAAIRDELDLNAGWAASQRTWTDAVRGLRNRIEHAGILVVFNGVVGNNTHRKLDPAEFRGFVLVDEYAPLIFVNGGDFKSAQMFTLVHELVHVWMGEGGVSNFEAMQPLPHVVERFCNAVAAEVLVPADELRAVWPRFSDKSRVHEAVARRFKVSTIVAARRALDLDLISRGAFFQFYKAWQTDERRKSRRGGDGGDFWNTQSVRIGHRFGIAVVRAVKEGRLLYRDAYALTGLRPGTFAKYVRRVEDQV